MPEVKPTKILSFSSEDTAYPADNLLKVSSFCKWKCGIPSAKQSSVTFKFDHPVQFNRLDIANEASAFIQIEVSRTDFDEFEVLLPSSSFMSPADSKKAVSLNRVRIFSSSELNMPIASQKWDIVKVICSQPFNKELQYGLSFIRFYQTPDISDLAPSVSIEEESSPSKDINEILKPGGLFKMIEKISKSEEKRALTNPTSIKPSSPETVTQNILQANRSVMDAQKSDSRTAKASSSSANSVHLRPPRSQSAMSSISNCTPTTNGMNAVPSTSRGTVSNIIGADMPKKKRKRILEGVVVAFSGYKNPFRSELRDLCLKLGAKYRQDWSDDCTHLICAFPNTPKWNAVKGKGVITSHRWIKECDRQQKRVSWRPYRVGRAPSPVGRTSDHEDDGHDDSDWEASIMEAETSDDWHPDSSEIEEEEDSEESEDASAEASSGANDGLTIEMDDDNDDETALKKKPKLIKSSASKLKASRYKARNTKSVKTGQPPQHRGEHKAAEDEDTDEEIQRSLSTKDTSSLLPFLRNIFIGRKFYIFSKDFEIKEEETVHRLIITFGGKVELHMNTDVEFVVSRAAWCDDFDEALEVCPSLIFVKPEWIYSCEKAGKFVPFQRYQIVG